MPNLKSNYSFNFRGLLISIIFATLLLISNILGWNKVFYKTLDTVLNPFLISTRNTGLNASFFLQEASNKKNVLQENINLKREILKYDELKVQNKELKDQISKLEAQTKILGTPQKQYQLTKVVGTQNTFASDPQVILQLDGDISQIKENYPVFYEVNTLFGFISRIEGRTVKVVPFYSPNIDSKIPVQILNNPQQKGFINPIENGIVRINNLPKDYKIQEGDIWVTTNDVVEVPPSYIVGKTKSIQVNQQDGFQEVELELPFTLSTLSYLLIEK
jgi:cell shape-determining protein MreC